MANDIKSLWQCVVFFVFFFNKQLFRVHQGFRGTVSPAQHECHSDTENNNIKKVREKNMFVCCFLFFTKST